MSFGTITYSFVFVVALITFFNFLLTILKTVTRHNATPYMDEIFHIPQAQYYCQYDFETWDNKITTLPGLYLVSIAIIKPLERALGGLELCSVYGLRFVNVLGTLFNFLLCYGIQQKLSSKKEEKGNIVEVVSALNIAAFPPLFFFTFLYYTDVWSTAFVLLMYFLHLSKSPILASLFGICAVLMRQTNIIWVGLLVLDSGWKSLAKEDQSSVSSFKTILPFLQHRLRISSIYRAALRASPYLVVCSLFLAFVIVNEGIVVGDRSAHKPVLHPMQNLYFLAVASFFAIPYAIWELPHIFTFRQLPLVCTIGVIFAVISECNLLEHPYLLADNRHLAFYIWKRSFGHPVLRRLLTPSYVLCGAILLRLLRNVDFMFLVFFAVCTAANLTPQYLFEIRYFIIPFILARLHFPQRPFAVYLETAFFAVINALVFYLFLTREIIWESEPEVIQRLIW